MTKDKGILIPVLYMRNVRNIFSLKPTPSSLPPITLSYSDANFVHTTAPGDSLNSKLELKSITLGSSTLSDGWTINFEPDSRNTWGYNNSANCDFQSNWEGVGVVDDPSTVNVTLTVTKKKT